LPWVRGTGFINVSGDGGIRDIIDRFWRISSVRGFVSGVRDEADWCDCSFGFTALLCERT
jgi:hypothetical protein